MTSVQTASGRLRRQNIGTLSSSGDPRTIQRGPGITSDQAWNSVRRTPSATIPASNKRSRLDVMRAS
jgi:hypothetical protein